jgi:iron(III) transport system ATP-binding protein
MRPVAGSQPQRRRKSAASFAASITLENVERRFGGLVAVNRISLDIEPAEIVCLVGPSGCGKTTLLRLICGLEPLDHGRILVDGKEMAGPSAWVAPERRSIGMMFQDFALFPHLKVIENVAFGLKGLGREQAMREALTALDRMGLADYAQDYPHVLSGGQQQRVALARAIVPRPRILLMDEPFSGLDPRLRASLRDETLAVLRETRSTCVIVTHEAEEAMRLGDRVVVMRGGHAVQFGSPAEIYQHPSDLFVAEMFSEVNAVPCEVSSQVATSVFGQVRTRSQVPDGPAIMCLRPHMLHLAADGAGVSARVLETRFLGDDALLRLGVTGLEEPVLMRIDASSMPAREAMIRIGIEPALVHVFACA